MICCLSKKKNSNFNSVKHGRNEHRKEMQINLEGKIEQGVVFKHEFVF